jgi:hypothetical protein
MTMLVVVQNSWFSRMAAAVMNAWYFALKERCGFENVAEN